MPNGVKCRDSNCFKTFHLNLFTKTLALISTATLILKSKVHANDIYLYYDVCTSKWYRCWRQYWQISYWVIKMRNKNRKQIDFVVKVNILFLFNILSRALVSFSRILTRNSLHLCEQKIERKRMKMHTGH